MRKYIEFRVFIDEEKYTLNDAAEEIKDMIYDNDEVCPVTEVTWEIKELPED